jgi:hypothetical protein
MSAAGSAKDKQMAAYLKERGIQRTTGNCPICHHLVGVGGGPLLLHFATSCR